MLLEKDGQMLFMGYSVHRGSIYNLFLLWQFCISACVIPIAIYSKHLEKNTPLN